MSSSSPTLRDHARGAVREEVQRCAWTLFAEQGYAATTVEQVAEMAGMSRRTFFRYFDGKDDLLLDRLTESGLHVAGQLADQPDGVPAWEALRRAMDVTVATQQANTRPTRALLGMLRREPEVRGALEERRRRWVSALRPVLEAREDVTGVLVADALSGAALACLESAQSVWAQDAGSDLAALLDQAMGAVTAGAGAAGRDR